MLFLATAACVGVLGDRVILPPTSVWIVSFLILVVWIAKGPSFGRTIASVLLLVPLGGIHHRSDQLAFESAGILNLVGERPQPAVLDVVVDRPPSVRRHPLSGLRQGQRVSPFQTWCEATVQSYRRGESFEPTSGRVLVTFDDQLTSLRVGDQLRLYGDIRLPAAPGNPGQRDLRSSYRMRRIHALLRVQDRQAVERFTDTATRFVARSFVHRCNGWVSSAARQSLSRHTDAKTYPFALAMVLGQRDLVDDTMRDQLLVTGTAHLLSISGLHLAIVASIVQWISVGLGLPRFTRIILLLIVCLAYTSVTGGRPPVVRAAVLLAVLSISWLTFRTPSPLNALGLAALLLLIWNPALIASVGVHLSFLAVATLLILGRQALRDPSYVDDEVRREKELDQLVEKSNSQSVLRIRAFARSLSSAFGYSLSVTLVCGPLVWYQFNIISPVSVLANLVLGPLMFLGLASGLTTIAFDWLFPVLAFLPGMVCELSLQGMQTVLRFAASIPGGHIWMPSPPAVWIVVFYAGLFLGHVIAMVRVRDLTLDRIRATKSVRRGAFRWRTAVPVFGLIWVGIAWWTSTHIPRLAGGVTEVLFVDVGHGTAVVLREGENQFWLYDCGHLGNDTGNSHGIQEALWSMGVTQLEGVMISHADADHFNALPGILARFGVAKIYTPPGMMDEPEPSLMPLRRAIHQHQVEIVEIACGDVLQLGALRASVMHPPSARLHGSDNANSLVILVHAGRDVLLPGDLEPPGTEALIDHPRPRAGGIVMAPHHGSLHAMADAVLKWARPSVVVISGGRRTESPRVMQALGDTGARVLGTHQGGAILVQVGPRGTVRAREWKSDPW